MNKDQLKNTPWAADFKADSPSAFDEALTLLTTPGAACKIYETTDSGPTLWVLDSIASPGFWFGARDNKEGAVQLAKSICLAVVD